MSPGPVTLAIAFFAWVLVLALLWRRRRWLLFYICGALFSVILVVLFCALTGLDTALEAMEARQVLALARPLGITLQLLGAAGLAIRNHAGWAVFDIGIECSGLLEITAMAGLVLFYPAVFSAPRKMFVVLCGTLATYGFNLLRVLLIVAIINAYGTDWVFPAHAVFGRVFFFLATIALYWTLITRPTVRHVGARLEGADE